MSYFYIINTNNTKLKEKLKPWAQNWVNLRQCLKILGECKKNPVHVHAQCKSTCDKTVQNSKPKSQNTYLFLMIVVILQNLCFYYNYYNTSAAQWIPKRNIVL